MVRSSIEPLLRRWILLGPKVSFTSFSPVSAVYGISAVNAALSERSCSAGSMAIHSALGKICKATTSSFPHAGTQEIQMHLDVRLRGHDG
jgi:hypothetical protein